MSFPWNFVFQPGLVRIGEMEGRSRVRYLLCQDEINAACAASAPVALGNVATMLRGQGHDA
jgi:hypothetical protein